MLRYTKLFTAVAALLATATANQGPGLGVSITESGANKAKNVIMPFIFSKLSKLEIPEVDFDGGYLKNIVVEIPQPPVDSVDIKFDSGSNGGELTCSDGQAHLNADFHYKYLFFNVDGQADIKINKAAIDVEIDAGTQQGTPTYDLAPKLTTNKININVNPDDIDIQLTGGLVAKIANVLIPLLKSSVIPSIIDQVTSQGKTLIDDTLDADLKVYGSQQEIPFLSGVTADYAQMAGPQFTSGQFFQMGVNGTFFDAQNIQKTSLKPVSFPLRDASGKDAQLHLTDYTIDTALEAGFQTGQDLDITYLLSKYLNVTVTTDVIAKVIPQVLTKYGSGKAVSISGKWIKAPASATFKAQKASGTGSLQVTMSVGSEVALLASFEDFSGEGDVYSKSGKVFGSTKVSAGSIGSEFKTTLGFKSGQEFMTFFQGQIDMYIGQLNQNLTAGVVIPTIMGIDVSDVEISILEGYAELGLSLSPTSWTQIAQAMGELKEYIIAKKIADYFAKQAPAAPVSEWKLKQYASQRFDRFGQIVDKKTERLSEIIEMANQRVGDIIDKQTQRLKDILPTVTVDSDDGQHWDLGKFLDQEAHKLTKEIEKKADKFEDVLENKVENFDEDFPKNKEKIISKLPDIEIISTHKRHRQQRIDRFLDKGFEKFDKILNGVGNKLDGIFHH